MASLLFCDLFVDLAANKLEHRNVNSTIDTIHFLQSCWRNFQLPKVVKENQMLHKGSILIEEESATPDDMNIHIFQGDVLKVQDSVHGQVLTMGLMCIDIGDYWLKLKPKPAAHWGFLARAKSMLKVYRRWSCKVGTERTGSLFYVDINLVVW